MDGRAHDHSGESNAKTGVGLLPEIAILRQTVSHSDGLLRDRNRWSTHVRKSRGQLNATTVCKS